MKYFFLFLLTNYCQFIWFDYIYIIEYICIIILLKLFDNKKFLILIINNNWIVLLLVKEMSINSIRFKKYD